jgi:hypothetical protein
MYTEHSYFYSLPYTPFRIDLLKFHIHSMSIPYPQAEAIPLHTYVDH